MRFSILSFATLSCLSTQFHFASSQDYCSTPDLASLESWAADVRGGIEASAGLTPIGTECPINDSRKKVLVIGIDGLRADAAAMLPLPNFRRLERIGSFSYWATVQESGSAVSGPGWASLFTGVEPSKHLVDGNGDVLDISDSYPTFMKAAKDAFGIQVAASVTWHPLIEMVDKQDPSTLDGSHKASNDADMVAKAIDFVKDGSYDLIFAAFDTVDATGHGSGFDGYAVPYSQAVAATDLRVGKLVDEVLLRSSGEEWLIVITTDHGGINFSHGGQDPYNRRIPFLVASNSYRVAMGRAPYNDPGSQLDVLPTVMHFLGGEAAIPTNLDGQVFGFKDYTRTKPSDSFCEGSDPSSCGCGEVNQADYRGTLAVTVTGRTCQRWDVQSPHSHSNDPEDKPLSGLEENYCRNPDGEDAAWCYTTDPDSRWELCAVPTCGEGGDDDGECANSDPTTCGCDSVQQADYRGTAAKTKSGRTCQRWDQQSPQSHTRTPSNYPDSGLEQNYCRNPDGEDGAWCYTTDDNVRWELCDVPTC